MTQPSLVDWDLARATARRLVRPGPQVEGQEAAEVVAELRAGAELSEAPVREHTGLHARSATAPVLVVDRPGWASAAVEGFAAVLEPLVDKIAAQRERPPGRTAQAVGAKITGAELGALLAFMSGKVLGQFDPFWDGPAGTTGRLLLVAPNVVAVERELGVHPRDFRMWVCLHEETHRVQFTAVPWMRDHLRSLVGGFVGSTDVDPATMARMLGDGIGELGRVLRGDPDASIVDVLQNPDQRAAVDAMTGVMSLLEGHADVVMDEVGPEVVPTVTAIRKRFEKRRAQGGSGLDGIVRRLLGLDAKMRQYRDGAAFVRAVTRDVGHEGFNAVWTGPEQLPSRAEILDPPRWVARVHG